MRGGHRRGGEAGFEDQLRRSLASLANEARPSPDALEQILAQPFPRRLRPSAPWWHRLARWWLAGPRSDPTRVLHAPARALAVVGAVVVLLGVGAGGAFLWARPGPLHAAGAPVVVTGAISAPVTPGPVAFVSSGRLWVTTAQRAEPDALSSSGAAVSNPEWSNDGQWLAYLVRSPGAADRVVMCEADGSRRRTVVSGWGLAFTWSPTSDVLAFTGDGGGLSVAAVDGTSRQVVPAGTTVSSFSWGPSGDRLAVTEPLAAPGSKEAVVVVPGQASASGPVDGAGIAWIGPSDTELLLAGWWPGGKGVLLWQDRGWSSRAESRGLPLYSAPLGGKAKLLAVTSVYLPWLVWAPGGGRLALVEGAGLPWQDKSLAVCRFPQESCRRVPQPKGAVSIDPTWSPDGTRLAFVRASSSDQLPPDSNVDTWYPSRRLWVTNAAGTQASPVRGASHGVASPRWVAGGTEIGYSTGGTVEVVSASGGGRKVLVRDLKGAEASGAGPAAYGKLPWGGLAVWAS
ncbi:MAG: hypothetical protein ACRDYD_01980 [Acidimicrobiales bacterium]